MSNIERTFTHLKSRNQAAFIPFIMAGDPNLLATGDILNMLAESGADIIELGMPFSDPMADGVIIQQAGIRALKQGTTIRKTLEIVRQFRQRHVVPIVLMGYYNPVLHYGLQKFCDDALQAGVDGLILVDLPPEEAAPLQAVSSGLDIIRLVSPVTPPERLLTVLAGAGGFVYYVAITGVTGTASADIQEMQHAVRQIRATTALPVGIGFGIKTPADAARAAGAGDAVIVGSSLVNALHTSSMDDARTFTHNMALAIHTARSPLKETL